MAEWDVNVNVAEHRFGLTYRRRKLENYEKALGGQLLAGVSRSFYTTLKVLPGATRGTIGLMYLLARAADTIADTEAVDSGIRIDFLARLDGLIQDGGDHAGFSAALRREFCPLQEHGGERELLDRVGGCLDWLEVIGEARQLAIRKVLKTIVGGQHLDLERFGGDRLAALETAADLDEYTYLVAGCVGEFSARLDSSSLATATRCDRLERCWSSGGATGKRCSSSTSYATFPRIWGAGAAICRSRRSVAPMRLRRC